MSKTKDEKLLKKLWLVRFSSLTFIFSLIIFSSLTINAQQTKPGKKFAPTGKLVDAGGHLLHLNCTGKGKSTVVVEAGTGDFSFDWVMVQTPVSQFTRICTYDRAGYAWSEPGPLPRTFQQITLELRMALKNAGEKGPFILVGHSYGGFLVRAYARYFPKEVAGMILVDSVQEDSRVIINKEAVRIREMAKGLPFPEPQVMKARPEKPKLETAATEENKEENKLEPPFDKLPAKIQPLHLWAQSSAVMEKARRAELDWSTEELARMYFNRGKTEYMLGNLPLIVISRGKGGYEDVRNASAKELEEERIRLQNELAKLSVNSKHIVTETDEHNIHLGDPGLIVDSIRLMVKTVGNRGVLNR